MQRYSQMNRSSVSCGGETPACRIERQHVQAVLPSCPSLLPALPPPPPSSSFSLMWAQAKETEARVSKIHEALLLPARTGHR